MMRILFFFFALLALPACVCGPGTLKCDNSCVDVQADVENCGACGRTCGLGQVCVEGDCAGGATKRCSSDADCSDNAFCTGVEHCVQGFCRPSPPVVCDDGIACTTETCSNSASACVARATMDVCPQGKRCTGSATAPDGCE